MTDLSYFSLNKNAFELAAIQQTEREHMQLKHFPACFVFSCDIHPSRRTVPYKKGNTYKKNIKKKPDCLLNFVILWCDFAGILSINGKSVISATIDKQTTMKSETHIYANVLHRFSR